MSDGAVWADVACNRDFENECLDAHRLFLLFCGAVAATTDSHKNKQKTPNKSRKRSKPRISLSFEMKFIECPKLLALTNALSGVNLGDRIVHGRIESYTCKSVKAEKQLSKEIEKQLVVESSPAGPKMLSPTSSGAGGMGVLSLGASAFSLAPPALQPGGAAAAAAVAATPSPLGPLNSVATRKLLVNLITTMNASFPDYDFSNLRPEQFEHETNRYFVQNSINV